MTARIFISYRTADGVDKATALAPGVRRFTPIFAPFRKVPSALARVSRS